MIELCRAIIRLKVRLKLRLIYLLCQVNWRKVVDISVCKSAGHRASSVLVDNSLPNLLLRVTSQKKKRPCFEHIG